MFNFLCEVKKVDKFDCDFYCSDVTAENMHMCVFKCLATHQCHRLTCGSTTEVLNKQQGGIAREVEGHRSGASMEECMLG